MIKYNKKKLDTQIQAILAENTSVYGQAIALEKSIAQSQTTDVNTLLCMASLEWSAGKATEFDEDIVDFGNSALSWLKKAQQISPEDSIETYIQKIEIEIVKATKRQKKELKYILEAEAQPVEILKQDSYLSEVAFYYYSRNTRSKENAEKGFRYYSYLYERVHAQNGQNESLLYYWNALTSCKILYSGLESAELEIKKLQNWQLAPGQHVYNSAISDGFWIELHHLSTLDDLDSFKTLFENWKTRMAEIAPNDQFLYYQAELVVPVSRWLLQKSDVTAILALIIEKCRDEFKTKRDLQTLAQMEETIQG